MEGKSKKRPRPGSSEEEEGLPDTLGSLIYQLGLTMVALKQHMGPGLARYIGVHEEELKAIYDALNALSEISSPLTTITQATQTDPMVVEDEMELVLARELNDEQLIDLLPKRWPNRLRSKLSLVTELPLEVVDSFSINDLNKMRSADEKEGMSTKYKIGDIRKDEQSILGECNDTKRSKYKIYYDSSATEKMGGYIEGSKKNYPPG